MQQQQDVLAYARRQADELEKDMTWRQEVVPVPGEVEVAVPAR
jgi:hypothetical protein